jgi:hypothetical protein
LPQTICFFKNKTLPVLHRQGRIVKPKINQFLLPDAAVAGWHCFLCSWNQNFTFDRKGM